MPEIEKLRPLELKGERKPKLQPKKPKETEEEEIPWIDATAEAIDMEGDIVTIDQLVGHLVYFYDVVERPSQFGDRPYVYVQIRVDDEPYVLRTGSAPVVGAILHQKKAGKIPFRAIVDEAKSARGRRYYVLRGPTTADQEE